MDIRAFDKSFEYLKRAKKLIPVCSQTFSKSYRWFPFGVYPVYLQRGEGSHVWDVDGNEYVDFILGLGVITLGYNYPAVNQAIMRQLDDGIIFSLPHPLEIEVSELLNKVIPCAQMVRFSKTGSEVTSAAIRAARAYTGRDKIAFRGYHGWHEWYSIGSDRPKGIPKVFGNYIHQFAYNDIGSLEHIFAEHPTEIAAVIMEPTIFQPPKDAFLLKVKELTHQNGAVLIFDEMVTGFRLALGGAQQYFGVVPDLATFGKGMANGMPISAVVGRRDIMREFEEVFFSTTFGGECLSLAAAKATINEMQVKSGIEAVWRLGDKLVSGLKAVGFSMTGYPCRPMILLDNETPEVRSLFMQECVKRGILMHSGAINLCFSHTEEDINRTISACTEAKEVLDKAVRENRVTEMLEGEVIQPSFRRF